MSDNPKHVTVRLRVPPELRDKIAASSEQYNRSMNADMVARLEDSFSIKQGDQNYFKEHLHLFLATYCAGLESNYDEAIGQINEALERTKDPEAIQYLEHRLQVNKILKAEMHRLMENNSEKYRENTAKLEGIESKTGVPETPPPHGKDWR